MKQKRYWLRGGIIGSIAGVALPAVIMIVWPPHPSGYDIQFQFKDIWIALAVTWGGPIIGGFIAGSFIGWLYGKIKNRKMKSNQL